MQVGQKSVAIQLDVSDIRSFDHFIGKLSSSLKENWNTVYFDFLINNAGIGVTLPITQVTEKILTIY